PTQSYQSINGIDIKEGSTHLIARAMAMGKMHKAFAVTGGICTSTAAMIEGTVVNEVSSYNGKGDIIIGHPTGTMNFDVDIKNVDGHYIIKRAAVIRTARRLMDGYAYIPTDVMWKT